VLPSLRNIAAWIDQRERAHSLVATVRQVLPGDSGFGDSLSTASSDPLHAAARRARTWSDRRRSVAAELGLAVLQVAEWLNSDVRRSEPPALAIVFTDLVGFSSWALRAGDEESLELLREVDGVVTRAVEERGGQVVKRLGDGIMAAFEEPQAAVDAADEAVGEISGLDAPAYQPHLRAGVHVGSPQAIGGDYLGVDVNVAARLCEAAEADEVLVSEPVRDRVDGRFVPHGGDRELRGAPDSLGIYSAEPPAAHGDRSRTPASGHRQ
jgi:adenylate cyclase